ncbi:MAG: hypothetical protein KKF39_07220 [Nanoarchaeota archaeon]|nr:hypothetical protein [Nanoarchaeota archaeon]
MSEEQKQETNNEAEQQEKQYRIVPNEGFPLEKQIDSEIKTIQGRIEEYTNKMRGLVAEAQTCKTVLERLNGALKAYQDVKNRMGNGKVSVSSEEKPEETKSD